DSFLVRRRQDVEHLPHELRHFPRRNPAPPLPQRLQRLAFEQIHDEKEGTVLGDAVVENANRPRVVNAVGRVALAQKADPNVAVRIDGVVKKLDRDAIAISQMRRREHRAHGPDSENAVESVFALEDSAEGPARRVLAGAGELRAGSRGGTALERAAISSDHGGWIVNSSRGAGWKVLPH